MRINLFQHDIHCVNVFLQTYIRSVNYVQQQRRLTGLLQGGFKRSHQIVRQMADKPNGIRQHGFTDIRYINAAQRRIQGRKQLVCGVHLGLSDLVK